MIFSAAEPTGALPSPDFSSAGAAAASSSLSASFLPASPPATVSSLFASVASAAEVPAGSIVADSLAVTRCSCMRAWMHLLKSSKATISLRLGEIAFQMPLVEPRIDRQNVAVAM